MARGTDAERRGRGAEALLLLMVMAAAMLAAAPALRNGLFWDDAIVLTRQVPAMSGIRGAFFPPRALPQFIPSYYRPVVFVTLLLDRAIWGSNLVGFHLDVWLLHAMTAGVFFLLMRRLIGANGRSALADRYGALAAGLLFAVHPVHAEAVAWIMGRADVLAALFAVLGLLAVVTLMRILKPAAMTAGSITAAPRATATAATTVAIGAASALALLSKESAIVMPVLAIVVIGVAGATRKEHEEILTAGRRWTRGRVTSRASIAATSAGIGLAIGLRLWAHAGASAAPATGSTLSWGEALARVPGAFVFALRRLVWPWPAPVFHAQVPPVGLSGVLGVLLFVTLVAASWMSSRSGRGAALFTGAALLPAFAPALTSVSLSPVADRYLYLPSVGVCWMAGAVVSRLLPAARSGRNALVVIAMSVGAMGVWAVAASGTSFRAVASYRDDAAFWSAALERSPSDPFLMMKHGQWLADAGRFAEAKAELRRALEAGGEGLRRSTRAVVLDNLGDIALRQGHLEEARRWLDQALSVGPGYAPAHMHLARLHRTQALAAAGDPSPDARAAATEQARLARAAVEDAIRLEPTSAEALLLRADLALDRGDKSSAIAAIREALRYMPEGADRARIESALRSLEG